MIEKLPSILADIPEPQDILGFGPYANMLRDLILSPATATPLTIAVVGGWGSGKSSLLRMAHERLHEAALSEPQGPETFTIWYNPSLYRRRKRPLWQTLVMHALSAIRKQMNNLDADAFRILDSLAEDLALMSGPAELGSLSVALADLFVEPGRAHITLDLQQGIGLLSLIEQIEENTPNPLHEMQRAVARLEQQGSGSLDQFGRLFLKLIREHIAPSGRLVLFVDDLDRCLPEEIFDVIEGIKHFFDVSGCICLVSHHREIIEASIRTHFQSTGMAEEAIASFSEGYLTRFFQLYLKVPLVSSSAMSRFIAYQSTGLPHPECGTVLAAGLASAGNPMQAKRSINQYALLWNLSRNIAEFNTVIEPVRLAKVFIIGQQFPDLSRAVADDPAILAEVERHFRSGAPLPRGLDVPGWANVLVRLDPASLSLLAMILTMHPEDADEMNFAGMTDTSVKPYCLLNRWFEEELPDPD